MRNPFEPFDPCQKALFVKLVRARGDASVLDGLHRLQANAAFSTDTKLRRYAVVVGGHGYMALACPLSIRKGMRSVMAMVPGSRPFAAHSPISPFSEGH